MIAVEGEAIDQGHLLGGRVALSQPAQGYRVSLDAVLLAAAADPPPGGLVLDLGCGVGAAALCLLQRRSDLRAVGLELQPALAALAAENARANGMAERFRTLAGDAADPPETLKGLSFDWAISNPPHHASGSGGASPSPGKTRANQEGSLTLGLWLDLLLRRLAPGGGLTLVHRADRLPDLLAGLVGRAGAASLLPLWPKAGRPAKRVLVTARKGGRGPARLLPGLVLHREDGSFTAEAEAVLRGGAALVL